MFGVFSVPWSRNLVGEERYLHFLSLAHGDQDVAVSLLAFDDDLCHSLQRDLRRIELMLRNGYDRTMRMLWPSKTHWLMDPSCYASQRLRQRYPELRRRIQDQSATPGLLVSSVTFGFWRQLTTASAEQALFVPYLRHSFNTGVSRAQVHAVVERLARLRNRVAHHEPVINVDLRPIVADMEWLSEIMLPPLHWDLRAGGRSGNMLRDMWVAPDQRVSSLVGRAAAANSPTVTG